MSVYMTTIVCIISLINFISKFLKMEAISSNLTAVEALKINVVYKTTSLVITLGFKVKLTNGLKSFKQQSQ